MATTKVADQPAPLSREIPATIHTEAIKGLFLINGGASTAMLVFLGTILDKGGRPFVPYVIAALMIFAVGLAIAGWVKGPWHRACSRRPVPSADPGQDRALAPDAQEPHSARELLFAR